MGCEEERSPLIPGPTLSQQRRGTDPETGEVSRGGRAVSVVRGLAALFGTSLVVMLADNDAPSLVTAAETGRRWGYAFAAPQLLLVAPVAMVQDLAVRLGAATGMGYGELLRRRYGAVCAHAVAALLVATCLATVAGELAAVSGVAHMLGGVSPRCARWGAAAGVWAALAAGKGAHVERACLCLGLCELLFVASALSPPPQPAALWGGVADATGHLSDSGFLFTAAANVGTSVMPWMVFYEQGAVVDKALPASEAGDGRRGALFAVFFSQCIIMAVVCAAARGWDGEYGGPGLGSLSAVARALSPSGGAGLGSALCGVAFAGSALNAAIVVSSAGISGAAEVLLGDRARASLSARSPAEAPGLSAAHAAFMLAAVLLTEWRGSVTRLGPEAFFANAVLMPVVQATLLHLASSSDVVTDPRLRLGSAGFACYAATIGAAGAAGLAAALAAL